MPHETTRHRACRGGGAAVRPRWAPLTTAARFPSRRQSFPLVWRLVRAGRRTWPVLTQKTCVARSYGAGTTLKRSLTAPTPPLCGWPSARGMLGRIMTAHFVVYGGRPTMALLDPGSNERRDGRGADRATGMHLSARGLLSAPWRLDGATGTLRYFARPRALLEVDRAQEDVPRPSAEALCAPRGHADFPRHAGNGQEPPAGNGGRRRISRKPLRMRVGPWRHPPVRPRGPA